MDRVVVILCDKADCRPVGRQYVDSTSSAEHEEAVTADQSRRCV